MSRTRVARFVDFVLLVLFFYFAFGAIVLLFGGCTSAYLGQQPREGVIEIVHADEYQGTATFEYALVAPDGTRERLKEHPLLLDDIVSGDRVRVLAEPYGPSKLELVDAAPRAATGARRVGVVILSFSDGANTLTPQTVRSVMAAVDTFYTGQSYNRLGMVTDVVGPLTLSTAVRRGTCNTRAIESEGRTLASKNGMNPASYQTMIYAFANDPGCNWGGLATVGNGIIDINGSFNAGTVAHELGHNLGLWHSHSLQCQPQSFGCTTKVEYGDTTDVMGSAYNPPRDFNAPQKQALGWVTPTTVTTSGDQRLTVYETNANAIQVAQGGAWVTAEYRTVGMTPGVYIHRNAGPDDMYLIDAQPADAWGKSALVTGTPLQVTAQTALSLVSQDSTGAVVRVGTVTQPPEPGVPNTVRVSRTASGGVLAEPTLPQVTRCELWVSGRKRASNTGAPFTFGTRPNGPWQVKCYNKQGTFIEQSLTQQP